MKKQWAVVLYFTLWGILAVAAVVLNTFNMDWEKTQLIEGIFLLFVLGLIQTSVLELSLFAIAALLVQKEDQEDKRASWEHLTLIMNYNLLAVGKDDIDETFEKMYTAYMGNLHPNVAAVLVSATADAELKKYELKTRDNCRALIRAVLTKEAEYFAVGRYQEIDTFRLDNFWTKLDQTEDLLFTVDKYVSNFMCIHRVSRVLRKCGQYQDLMLLSRGEKTAYTYTCTELYGRKARTYNEPLFHASNDVDTICNANYYYTFVLDGDTVVPPGAALELMAIAAANPDAVIIQSAIAMDVNKNSDTIFMHIEKIKQDLNEPLTHALCSLLGKSGFYGKGLIQNKGYIERIIGSRERPMEIVPIDVLSHDTFEAAVLKTYYAGSVSIFEAPCFNYVSWDIRESRWNKGEALLSMYFWETLIGRPIKFLQKHVQGRDFVETRLRSKLQMDFISSYLAHSACRQMYNKPLLLIFILLHININLHFVYLPVFAMIFMVMIFPKITIIRKDNFKYILLETVYSGVWLTSEALVGTIRFGKAYWANICNTCNWKPQSAVEEEFRNSNPMLSSLKHLWCYSLLAVAVGAMLWLVSDGNIVTALFMLGTVFVLPVIAGLTSYTLDFQTPQTVNIYRNYRYNGIECFELPKFHKSL